VFKYGSERRDRERKERVCCGGEVEEVGWRAKMRQACGLGYGWALVSSPASMVTVLIPPEFLRLDCSCPLIASILRSPRPDVTLAGTAAPHPLLLPL
jgi:hypothetical protein